MSDPLKVTFDVLASSRSGTAVDVLIRALGSTEAQHRIMAARALMFRQSTRGKVEVIRLFDDLPADFWVGFKASNDSFENALTQCLGHGELALKLHALEIIRITGTCQHVPAIIAALNQHEDKLLADRAEETLRWLVCQLYDQLQSSDPFQVTLRNSQMALTMVMTALDEAVEKYPLQARPAVILESILILGTTQHPAVKKALWQSPAACRDLAHEILQTSIHPGVLQLLFSQLGEKLPHPRMLSIISNRCDLTFVATLLRLLSKRITVNQQRNLKQITSFSWVDESQFDLSLIPMGLHASLIAVVVASGIPASEKAVVQQWMLKHGSAEGRQAAATLMSLLDEGQLQSLVLESLDSEDEHVQVWATSQLRDSHLPNAISLLVERLDSPEPAVREVARQELSSFNLAMVMEMCEHLDPVVCQRAAQIMLKINPDAISELHRELAHPLRAKRMKAMKAIKRMGLHRDLISAIAPLAHDSDPLIRRTLIELLVDVPTRESGAILHHLTFDTHERVREDALMALEQLALTLRRVTSGHSILAGERSHV